MSTERNTQHSRSSINIRLPACEPCRRSKLACDHGQPTCVRCRDRGQGDTCIYRATPFKRQKLSHSQPIQRPTCPSLPPQASCVITSSPATQHHYPNPGFLGTSSHSTIFNHVSSQANNDDIAPSVNNPSQMTPSSPIMNNPHEQAAGEKGMRALNYIERLDVYEIKALVDAWLIKDVNLPLAGPFVSGCAQAVLNMMKQNLSLTPDSGAWAAQHAETLLKNTQRPIVFQRDSSVADFISQIYGDSVRWETIGIFFAAACRATLDIAFFPSLYTNKSQRRTLTLTLTSITDCCLETCLSLDCLNDLQLILQYESFIVHSQVYGDQNKRIGDVASSLFALGYNENIGHETLHVPNFITELRKAAFSRIYSADKNLAVFLGRPPRIVKAYCDLQLPSNIPGMWDVNNNGDDTTADVINYTADTRCSALFASLKEEILELFRDRDPHQQAEKASLKDCHLKPFERDFLVGTRLDHLHTLLLLHLVSIRHIHEPNDSLLNVAIEMLSLVVEVIVLREYLVNSGTCLVAHYGLPAAGIISLALLSHSASRSIWPFLRSKMLQDLSVLVAEIRTGAVIEAGEPNFALFNRATKTIQSLLTILLGGELPPKPLETQPEIVQQHPTLDSVNEWGPWISSDPWDFEIDFWVNLAEHPSLQGFEHGI
ncbi:hypothetical protein B0O99DRAFT_657354 [Bisporella sp. PMI_857]|nr:hypothetical protein B0O99DRAFT_657354 [Bisporella sp. PMI_857]